MKLRLITFTITLAMASGAAPVASAAPATDLVCTGCVQTTDLANLAVTNAKLGANSVGGAKILDGSVGTADLAAGSVDTTKIKDGSVGLGDLAADSVDGTKIKNGSVGLADLALNSVDSNKITNGSIAQVDLNAALLARLAAMEARLAALEGGPYSNATFKGTYRCSGLEVVERGEMAVPGGWAGMEIGSFDSAFTADGAGSATSEGLGSSFARGWNVARNTAGAYYLNVWEDVIKDEPAGPDSLPYTVSADGRIDFGLAGVDAWISRNGDTVIIRVQQPTYPDDPTKPRHGYSADLEVCVRTAR